MSSPFERLSIVVPVGPGERAWAPLLPALPREAEVVLAACTDDAPRLRDGDVPALARITSAAVGRAAQQNAGARAATREWLWFLHADSRLAPRTLDALRGALDRDAIGWFDLRFRDDGPAWCALNALGARLRSRWFALPFGDQGLLVRRATFDRLGGFDESLRLGEDLDFVRRARAAGVPLRAAGAPLYTSARRYAERGWLRTTLRNVRLTVSLSRAADRRIREARA